MRMSIRLKTKLMVRKSVALDEFLFKLATIFIILYALLEHMSISIPFYSSLKLPILYVAGICLVPQVPLIIKNFKKKKNFSVLITVVLVCLASFLSMRMNPRSTNVTRGTIRFILYMTELFVMVMRYEEKENVDELLHVSFVVLAILVVLTDFLIFTGWVTFVDGQLVSYLIGTKFNVAYAHMGLLILWVVKDLRLKREERVTKFKILFGAIMSLVISVMVDCMTGVLGVIVLLIFLPKVIGNQERTNAFFISTKILTAFLVGSVVFAFIVDEVVNIPLVTKFVSQIMNRSTTLTGRTTIYSLFVSGMNGHWMWGYGFGNSFKAAFSLYGVANVQNALLEWLFVGGIPSAVLLVVLIVLIFKRIKFADPKQRKVAMPVVLLIYTYVIMGTVEITFDMSFLLWLALLFAIINTQQTTEKNCLGSGDK